MQTFFKLQTCNPTSLETYSHILDSSPHKLSTKVISPRIQTQKSSTGCSCSAFYNNNVVNNQQDGLNKGSSQNSKRILILDESVVQTFIDDGRSNKIYSQKNENKTVKKQKRLQPLNPFEQILQEYDTPDFNMSLPFVDEFSKIQLKSPTFSDVFNLSQLKSPQINNQQLPNKFFIASKKIQKEKREIQEENESQQIDETDHQQERKFNLKLDFSQLKKGQVLKKEISFISQIKISKPLQTPKKKSSQQINPVKPLTPAKVMSEQTYKLRNHNNPLTPKIKNVSSLLEQQNKNVACSKILFDESVESNPQIEGKFTKPYVSYNQVKNKISPRLQQSFHITDNLPTKRSHEQSFKTDSLKLNLSRTSPYKRISIKKLQLQQQLQEIYNGKFKLNRTMRF